MLERENPTLRRRRAMSSGPWRSASRRPFRLAAPWRRPIARSAARAQCDSCRGVGGAEGSCDGGADLPNRITLKGGPSGRRVLGLPLGPARRHTLVAASAPTPRSDTSSRPSSRPLTRTRRAVSLRRTSCHATAAPLRARSHSVQAQDLSARPPTAIPGSTPTWSEPWSTPSSRGWCARRIERSLRL